MFWYFNVGLALMVLIDLFPAGLDQLNATMAEGLWYSRSEEYIQSDIFQYLTWARIAGGGLFVLGGLLPFVLFVVRSSKYLKKI